MTPAEEKLIKPSKNREGGFHDRTEGDRRVNLALQLVDYDVNDWFLRKPKHNEATDRIIDFIRRRARESSDPIEVSITGSASRTGSKEYDDRLSCRRAHGVTSKLRAFLSPAILRRLTVNASGEGFTHTECRGRDCELPEHRSTLICVHAPGEKPRPVPVVPPGWNQYKIRCYCYESQDLLAGTLGDILDKDLGKLPDWMHERIATWMATLVKKGLESTPKIGGKLATVLKFAPIQLIRDRAVFEILERDRPSPGSMTLHYEGTGMRLDVPDLDFVDRSLPHVSAPARALIKDLLLHAGVRTGIPPLTSRTPGPFKSFDLNRPALIRDFAGSAFMGRDATASGRVSVVFASPTFRTFIGHRAAITNSNCSDCKDNVVPVQVGDSSGFEVLAFTDGRLASTGSLDTPALPDRLVSATGIRPAPLARSPSIRRDVPFEWELSGEMGGDTGSDWTLQSAGVPERHRFAYGHAQQAELVLDDEALDALTFELLAVRDDAELEQFLGKLVSKVTRAVSNVAKTVSKGAAAAARGVAKAASTVGKVVAPVIGTVAKLASHSPLGSLARSTWGAISAAVRGENILMGALDGLAGTPLLRGLVKMGGAVLRGENVIEAAKLAVKGGIDDAREAVRFAAMVAPFVPGIGAGVGAALGAANALASGQPITEVMIAAVRGSIPGGVIAQAAFDAAANLARGQRIDQALLGAARNQLPPGPAQAAFDTGLTLARGKNLQEAMLAGAGRLLPPSPYAGDAMSFARRALAGENLGRAALSTAGDAVLRRVQKQGGDLIGTVQGRAQARVGQVFRAQERRLPGAWRRELSIG